MSSNLTNLTSLSQQHQSQQQSHQQSQQHQQQQNQPPPSTTRLTFKDSSSSSTNYYNNCNNAWNTPPPPVSDFKIGTFTLNANGFPSESNNQETNNSTTAQTNGASNSSNSSNNSQSVRETGIIEKLLQTYGFIQCCERQARLFFHFSQFEGNTEHLRIGDPVEFEVTFDRRTGKPIASSVTKISPDVVLSEERVIGIVTTELRSEHSGSEHQGRITYENRGECFFLPYGKDDVEGYVTLKPGDKVSFQIATNQRTGNLGARHVRLENPAQPVKYQGVVSTIKDSYGFIERADVVDEIFFHFSEAKTIPGGLKLGDDVEFLIQTRNAKEVATNMVKLDAGTVVFEDINSEQVKGQVLKPVERNPRQNQKDPLTGRIRYRGKDRSEVEVKFGERDQKGDFTLRHGDWVQFNIAEDRRDHLQKATNIELMDDSFSVSGEKREQGIIAALKDGFGFIKCADRDARMFFHYNELLNPEQEITVNEEVEFTVVQVKPEDTTAGAPNRQNAIRIAILPRGTVTFESLIQEGLTGTVIQEAPGLPRSPFKKNGMGYNSGGSETPPEPGIISFQIDALKQNINFYGGTMERAVHVGDKVTFNMYQIKRTKELIAMNVKVARPNPNLLPTSEEKLRLTPAQHEATPEAQYTNGNPITILSNGNHSTNGTVENVKAPRVAAVLHQGFIAALKDTFGFIETIAHDKEIFFHFSNVDGDAGNLDLGQEVEYTLSSRTGPGGKVSAENVRSLPKGTLAMPKVLETVYEGTILRSMRSINPDQSDYCGLVCIGNEDEDLGAHEFGITGILNKRELLQPGDQVNFQLDESRRAVCIRAIRKKLIATVDAVKGQYGFLNYETEEGKKLFFHQSEVKDGNTLSPGDDVEFVIITNQKTGKSSACSIARIMAKEAPQARPERLIHRLKTMNLNNSGKPSIKVIRQPKGPDGTKGFKIQRTCA